MRNMDRRMALLALVVLVAAIVLLLGFLVLTDNKGVGDPQQFVGTWHGVLRPITIKHADTTVPLQLEVHPDLTVSGKLGGARLADARLQPHPWAYRKIMRHTTEYNIQARLEGGEILPGTKDGWNRVYIFLRHHPLYPQRITISATASVNWSMKNMLPMREILFERSPANTAANQALPQEKICMLTQDQFDAKQVLDLATGKFVPREASSAYIAWARLVGVQFLNTAGIQWHGVSMSTGAIKHTSQTRNADEELCEEMPVAANDLWAISRPEDLPAFDPSSQSDAPDTATAPFADSTAGLASRFPVPYLWAFKTVRGDMGVIEVLDVHGKELTIRYKLLKPAGGLQQSSRPQ